ncbi:hypothetical protein RIF29_29403 [Crotalaria pallida]|uniref:Ubiquitin-like domain-containing protein n=1 Tax=Crotalaria pallida TaxID=3830 RepID=A0AAN9EEI8_CROPI
MFLRDVKKEKLEDREVVFSDEERLGARQCNLVRLGISSGEKPITLIVKGQNEEDLYYRMGMNTSFKVMMKDYCERKGLGFGTVKFLDPEGTMLNETHTPEDRKLEDGDAIDAFTDQIGG